MNQFWFTAFSISSCVRKKLPVAGSVDQYPINPFFRIYSMNEMLQVLLSHRWSITESQDCTACFPDIKFIWIFLVFYFPHVSTLICAYASYAFFTSWISFCSPNTSCPLITSLTWPILNEFASIFFQKIYILLIIMPYVSQPFFICFCIICAVALPQKHITCSFLLSLVVSWCFKYNEIHKGNRRTACGLTTR